MARTRYPHSISFRPETLGQQLRKGLNVYLLTMSKVPCSVRTSCIIVTNYRYYARAVRDHLRHQGRIVFWDSLFTHLGHLGSRQPPF